MQQFIRFSFALSPRMQSFLECRNALQCLDYARKHQDVYGWLQAIQDLQESLQGSTARKPAVPEIIGLVHGLQKHLKQLSKQAPNFRKALMEAHDSLGEHEITLAGSLPVLLDMMINDGVIQSWINCQKKQDWLGHRLFYPQALPVFWKTLGIQDKLNDSLQDFHAMMSHVDGMLHDFVPWQDAVAQGGCDQILLSGQPEACGLLIVGLPTQVVQSGITPEFSGNRHAVRVRFQQCQAGEPYRAVDQDLPYRRMLVPIT